jgi:rare lipoprotein A
VRLAGVAIAVLLAACGSTAKHPATKPTTAPASSGVSYGLATFYGKEAQGGPTASGERFDMHKLTAAHRTLHMGTRVRVTNRKNGRTVEVRINDRGPYGSSQRIIDLSEAAAKVLDMIDAGVVPVKLEVLH